MFPILLKKWLEKHQALFARWLIRFGRLRHVSYTVAELDGLIRPYLPYSFDISTPAGPGKVALLNAHLQLPRRQNNIHVVLYSSLEIKRMGSPIYRAHINIKLRALPHYDPMTKSVGLKQARVNSIKLVQDEYAMLSDTRTLINKLNILPVSGVVTNTMKNTLSLMTAGTSDALLGYLNLYLTGSKQRILDYHQPQIETQLNELTNSHDLRYKLNPDDWQEKLFIECGRSVTVNDGELHFKF